VTLAACARERGLRHEQRCADIKERCPGKEDPGVIVEVSRRTRGSSGPARRSAAWTGPHERTFAWYEAQVPRRTRFAPHPSRNYRTSNRALSVAGSASRNSGRRQRAKTGRGHSSALGRSDVPAGTLRVRTGAAPLSSPNDSALASHAALQIPHTPNRVGGSARS